MRLIIGYRMLFFVLVQFCVLSQSLQTEESAQRIVEEPSSVSVLRGDAAVLKCRVEHQAGKVHWTKNRYGLGFDRALAAYERYSMVGSSAEGKHACIEYVKRMA